MKTLILSVFSRQGVFLATTQTNVLFLTSSCWLGKTTISCQKERLIVNGTHKCICCQMANSTKWRQFPWIHHPWYIDGHGKKVFFKAVEFTTKFSQLKVKLHALSHFVENWPILYFFQTNRKPWVFDSDIWKVRVEDFNTFVTSTQKLRKIKLAEPIWFGSQSVIVRNTK